MDHYLTVLIFLKYIRKIRTHSKTNFFHKLKDGVLHPNKTYLPE